MKRISTLAILALLLGASAAFPLPPGHSDTTASRIRKPPAHGTDSAADTFNFHSGTIVGVGIGLSLGSIPPFDTWESGLPQSLTDLGLTDSSFQIQPSSPAVPGDTSRIAYTVRQSPDIYSMTFPVTLYFSRLTPNHRLTAALSFAWLSKEYDARVSVVNDSSRYFDLRQTLGLYSFTGALTWGTRIPERFFSVDEIDRTDAMIGILASPWLSLTRSTSIGAPPTTDTRLTSVYDSIVPQMRSFSAAGIAYGWRIGLATIRHHSKHSGIEAEITYSGMWNTRFGTSSGTLMGINLGNKSSDADKAVSYYSSRIEISISVFRKLF